MMTMTSMPERVARITELLAGLRTGDGVVRPIRPDESLPDAGVSSLQMVNLMLAIEADFDLFIPAEDVNPRNFGSIAAIATLVDKLDEPSKGQ